MNSRVVLLEYLITSGVHESNVYDYFYHLIKALKGVETRVRDIKNSILLKHSLESLCFC